MDQQQVMQEQAKVNALNGINATLGKILAELTQIRAAQQQLAKAADSKT
jgi:hypothetical protein